MFLPGEKYQPQTTPVWKALNDAGDGVDPALMEEYFQDQTRGNYNFDPIYMGDGSKR